MPHHPFAPGPRNHSLQQAAVAELGERESRGGDAVRLMEDAAAVVSRALQVPLVVVAEMTEDRSGLILRAGTGWDPDVVGATTSAGQGSLVGHVAATQAPLVVEDVHIEERCHPSDIVHVHRVTSAAVVPIMGGPSPFGALGVFSRERRRFDADEVNFLRAIAHVLHSAVARAEMAERLRDVRDDEHRPLPLTQRRVTDRARVLLVDDHAATREAIALALGQDDEFVIAGQVGSLAEARERLDGVDVAIVDLELPDGDGADLIEELRTREPRVHTLVLTAQTDRASVARAVQRGAAAVLAKTTHLHEVVSAARRVRAGETLVPLEEVVELLRFADRRREREIGDRRLTESLSPREREVLQLLAAGLDSATIAGRLFISPRTQRNHVANILAKLEVHSQLQAVVFALRHGVVELPRA